MMNTNTQKHFQWVIESGAVLILIGVALNFLVMQTLGSFDAASVILALFLGFWAFILGNSVLFFSSIWFFMRKRAVSAVTPTRQLEVREFAPVRLPALGHHRPCPGFPHI